MSTLSRLAGIALLAGAAALTQPVFAQQPGFGVKFDKTFQNLRASPNTAQWQSGKMVTVFLKEAAPPGVTLRSLARN